VISYIRERSVRGEYTSKRKQWLLQAALYANHNSLYEQTHRETVQLNSA